MNRFFPAWTSFFAGRFFKTKRKEKGQASSILSVLGLSIGIMALISVIGVMNGFQQNFIDNILDIGSFHIQIRSEKIDDKLLNEIRSSKLVTSVMESGDVDTLISSPYSDSQGVSIKLVPKGFDQIDTSMTNAMELVQGSLTLDDSHSILLGQRLAYYLGVTVGDPVNLVIYKTSSRLSFGKETQEFTVRGTFKTGYLDYDAGLALISLDDGYQYFINPKQTYIGVKLINSNLDHTFIRNNQWDGVQISSWRDFNKSFFGALRMEKTMMLLLVGLIFLVVGFNIYHSMTRSVLERSEEIAILRAIGVVPKSIQGIFLWEGLLIGGMSALIGTGLGLFIGININEIFLLAENLSGIFTALINPLLIGLGQQAIEPLDFYSSGIFYTNGIPCHFHFGEVFFITLLGVSAAWIASYCAARKVSELQTMEILRNE